MCTSLLNLCVSHRYAALRSSLLKLCVSLQYAALPALGYKLTQPVTKKCLNPLNLDQKLSALQFHVSSCNAMLSQAALADVVHTVLEVFVLWTSVWSSY